MRIGIDACSRHNLRGLGRFTRQLIRSLQRDFATQHDFVLLGDSPTVSDPSRARSPLELGRLSWQASRAALDVILFPTVYTWFPVMGVPSVVTFHDAMPWQQPAHFFPSRRAACLWRLKGWLAHRRARALLTPSQQSRQQLMQALGLREQRLTVIGEAAAPIFRVHPDAQACAKVLRHRGVPEGTACFLYVGSQSPHKNLAGLLRGLARVEARQAGSWRLLVVGALRDASTLSCQPAVRQTMHQLGLQERVDFLGFVPDDELVALYNAATALVLPSLDEGFGLPVVEAMACGLPVAASDGGALPEVLGGAGLLFDPRDVDAMAGCLLRLLREPELRGRLRAAGLERALAFSWRRTARRVMEVLCAAARGGPR